MIGLSIEGCARAVYDAISTECAKIVIDTRGYEVLVSYGSSYYTKQCEGEVRELDALQGTSSLQTASYIVAFHQKDHVRMLGFSEERAACAVFGAVPDELARVLVNRWHSEVSFWADVCCNVANQLEAIGVIWFCVLCQTVRTRVPLISLLGTKSILFEC
ncbi:hypothetical protein EDD85DRAFT_342911 [Armillaria nabsnona]|nr:hypothetical protein EDD85DRAFT_342911 [Armillaria nabsnona]